MTNGCARQRSAGSSTARPCEKSATRSTRFLTRRKRDPKPTLDGSSSGDQFRRTVYGAARRNQLCANRDGFQLVQVRYNISRCCCRSTYNHTFNDRDIDCHQTANDLPHSTDSSLQRTRIHRERRCEPRCLYPDAVGTLQRIRECRRSIINVKNSICREVPFRCFLAIATVRRALFGNGLHTLKML